MAPKENANPMILNVEKDRRLARRQPLEWKLLGNFEQGDDELKWLPTTPEDRALLQALVDSSKATNRKGVSLLENAGLVIPDSTKTALKHPQFHPSEIIAPAKRTDANPPLVSDKFGVDEVFDIIRNIQDPEHPHTLEQLGVVNLEQIEVNDLGPQASQSAVNVRFT